MKNELVAKDFCKKYGPDDSVFENVNFRMEGGHIYGLMAPNGFGKSTLMKCIAGTSCFTGDIYFNKVKVGSHFNGRIVHSLSVPLFEYSTLKVTEFLHSVAIVKGIEFDYVFEKFRESRAFRFKNSRCFDLSTGQKKIFQLFIDFLSDPEVVLLDEPFNGLDPRAREDITSNFSMLAKKGKIVVISTHIFSDIEKLTDKVFIAKDGLLSFHEGEKISEVYNRVFPSTNTGDTINF